MSKKSYEVFFKNKDYSKIFKLKIVETSMKSKEGLSLYGVSVSHAKDNPVEVYDLVLDICDKPMTINDFCNLIQSKLSVTCYKID